MILGRSASILIALLAFLPCTGSRAAGQDDLAARIAEQLSCTETILDRNAHIEPEVVRDIPQVPSWCSLLPLEKHRIRVGDCELYCETEGAGTPIVLLHGGPGATHHYFHPAFSRAADFARVIYYDQRGCGVSDYHAGAGYSLEQALDDLDRLREALGFDQWIVLGHSYGGLVAQSYVLKYPNRVKGLILVGASLGFDADTGDWRQSEYLSKEERARIREIQRMEDLSLAQRVYNAFLNGDWKRQHFCKPTADQFARIALYEWKQDPEFRSALNSQTSWLDLWGGFEGCPIPTLIVEGKWDLTWGAKKAEVLRSNHPNARLVIVDRAGHSPFASNPDEFFPLLREFVTSLPDVATARVAAWKERSTAWREQAMPESLLAMAALPWGHRSSVKIAEAYRPEWLTHLRRTAPLVRIGFALYDVKRYEDALAVYRRMAEAGASEAKRQAVAYIWQGHMFDLLGRRVEAIAAYQKAVDLKVTSGIEHSQYNLVYKPSEYAAMRLTVPFERIENKDQDN